MLRLAPTTITKSQINDNTTQQRHFGDKFVGLVSLLGLYKGHGNNNFASAPETLITEQCLKQNHTLFKEY